MWILQSYSPDDQIIARHKHLVTHEETDIKNERSCSINEYYLLDWIIVTAGKREEERVTEELVFSR